MELPIDREDRIADLVLELGNVQFQMREQAERKLMAEGKEILPILEKLGKPDDPEAAIRYCKVVSRFRVHPLQGTKWLVKKTSEDTTKEMTIEFVANGKFRVLGIDQHTPEDETWDEPEAHPDGDIIRFHFNDKYSTYTGHRIDSQTIVGSSENIKGVKWTWRATLVE